MGVFNRFRRREPQPAETGQATGCYICGAPAKFHCDMCGKLMCNAHTAVGTATCTECQEKSRAYIDKR